MISAKNEYYIIHWNYIKNTTIYQTFIEIQWLVDFRKDSNFLSFNYILCI